MRYYIIPKEEKNLKIISERWCIGEEGLGTFYTKSAWKIFMELIDKSSLDNNLLDYYIIIDPRGKEISLEKFLEHIIDLKVNIE